jgi:hypothetical protein
LPLLTRFKHASKNVVLIFRLAVMETTVSRKRIIAIFPGSGS